MPPKNDEFSLTSGDFPTLGSAKENSGKNADSQGFMHLELLHLLVLLFVLLLCAVL